MKSIPRANMLEEEGWLGQVDFWLVQLCYGFEYTEEETEKKMFKSYFLLSNFPVVI